MQIKLCKCGRSFRPRIERQKICNDCALIAIYPSCESGQKKHYRRQYQDEYIYKKEIREREKQLKLKFKEPSKVVKSDVDILGQQARKLLREKQNDI